MALVTWAFIGLVLALVVALVVVKLTQGAPAVSPPPPAAPAAAVSAISGLPARAFDAGAGSGFAPGLTVLSGQPALNLGGQPAVVFAGAEFSPYSAAASWALVVALSRFGTFSQLGAVSSAKTEVFPGTPGFGFDGATYRSSYVSLDAVDLYGQTLSSVAPAGYPALGTLDPTLTSLLNRYDAPATQPTLPFVDVGNVLFAIGAGIGLAPGALAGQSLGQVAGTLGRSNSASGSAILAVADELSAAVCAVDGGLPPAVCAGAGVRAAAAHLGLPPSG
jgi:hypothetical protein